MTEGSYPSMKIVLYSSNFVQPPLFSNIHPHCFFCCLKCRLQHNDMMDLHMLNLSILVPQEPYCGFYVTRLQVYEIWYMWLFLLVLWFDFTHTHINTHKTHLGQKTDTPILLCTNTTCNVLLPGSALHWMINS